MADFEIAPVGTVAELEKVRAERDAMAAHVERVRSELRDRAVQAWCGCEHPACKRCRDDTETERVLAELPTASLARLKAEWQAAAISEWAARHLGGHEQELAEIYAAEIRHQAEGGE